MVLDAPALENRSPKKELNLINTPPCDNIQKILIIQTAYAGDVILTTPLIRAAKLGFPTAEIYFLAMPTTANVLENNPNLFRILLYDKRNTDSGVLGFFRLLKKLKKQQFDLVLVPHRSLRSALLALGSGAPIRIGFDKSAGSFLFTRKVHYRKDIHEVDRNLSLLEIFNIKLKDRSPEIFPDQNDFNIVKQLLKESSSELIAAAPGSVWPTKRWPKESFAQLCGQFLKDGKTVVLVGGKDDRNLCEEIAYTGESNVVNLAGLLTLRQSAELLQRCRVVVTNDSAPMHLAAAVGTPTVAIFGPTIPGFGFYPYRSNSKVVEKALSCRPCGIHGGNKCPIGTHECMVEISAAEVMKAAIEVMINESQSAKSH